MWDTLYYTIFILNFLCLLFIYLFSNGFILCCSRFDHSRSLQTLIQILASKFVVMISSTYALHSTVRGWKKFKIQNSMDELLRTFIRKYFLNWCAIISLFFLDYLTYFTTFFTAYISRIWFFSPLLAPSFLKDADVVYGIKYSH